MPATLPPDACAIVVPAAADAAPTCFVGLAVHGNLKVLETFVLEAKKRGIRSKLLANEPPEAMVLFIGTDRAKAFELLNDSVAGRLGQLQVGVVVAPADKARDGLEMDELTVGSPDYLKASR